MSKMGAMPLYLAIILARANAYSHMSATLCVSGTINSTTILYDSYVSRHFECMEKK